MSENGPPVGEGDVRALFVQDDRPLSSDQVADRLGVTREAAETRLDALTDAGALDTTVVGGGLRVWWCPARSGDRTTDHDAETPPPTVEVLDVVDAGIVVFDDRLRPVYANERVTSLLDLEVGVEGGAPAAAAAVVCESFTDRFADALAEGAETGDTVILEERFDDFDAWFEFRIHPTATGAVVWIHDVSDRKRIERALRTEKEQFRVALQNSPVVAFRLDPDLRYTWVGNPHEDFDADAVIGKRDDELLPPEAAETVMAPKRRVLETGAGVREEVTYDHPSGEVTYDLTVEPLRDESGDLVGLTCAALDVTEQRRRERELNEQNERLDRFTRVLSHDLRGPLAVAAGRAALIGAHPEETDDHIEALHGAHDRMQTLIDDVLAPVRRDEAPIETTAVSLEQVAGRAWSQVSPLRATLEVDTDQTVEANESRLEQLFENLFRNAVEHAAPDGQSDDGPAVRVGSLDDDSGFYIADSGPGIPESDLKRVFEDGFTTREDGTGLGLGIVQQVATIHGWTVEAVDTLGGGARFEIRQGPAEP